MSSPSSHRFRELVEGMFLVNSLLFTFFTEIVVRASSALVASSNNWRFSTSIALYSIMDALSRVFSWESWAVSHWLCDLLEGVFSMNSFLVALFAKVVVWANGALPSDSSDWRYTASIATYTNVSISRDWLILRWGLERSSERAT
jgi:hypothetical protein